MQNGKKRMFTFLFNFFFRFLGILFFSFFVVVCSFECVFFISFQNEKKKFSLPYQRKKVHNL